MLRRATFELRGVEMVSVEKELHCHLLHLRIQVFRKFRGLHVLDNRTKPTRCSKNSSSKAAGESKPEAYPLGRTVRRIRSTKFVRAAESVRRPGPR
jgi:hypothetical protein